MEQAVYNGNSAIPLELQQFQYRKLFGLSAAEMEAEPADQFFLNLWIYDVMRDKERLNRQHGNS